MGKLRHRAEHSCRSTHPPLPCAACLGTLTGRNSGSWFHKWLQAGIGLQMTHRITRPGVAKGGWLCHRVLEERGPWHWDREGGAWDQARALIPGAQSGTACRLLSHIAQADLKPIMYSPGWTQTLDPNSCLSRSPCSPVPSSQMTKSNPGSLGVCVCIHIPGAQWLEQLLQETRSAPSTHVAAPNHL